MKIKRTIIAITMLLVSVHAFAQEQINKTVIQDFMTSWNTTTDAEAAYNLGLIYATPESSFYNIEKALIWFERAAKANHQDANYFYKLMSQNGKPKTKKTKKKAKRTKLVSTPILKDSYEIKPNDNLNKIVVRYLRGHGHEINNKVITAKASEIFKANPDVFIRNDINRIKLGAVIVFDESKQPKSDTVLAKTQTKVTETVSAGLEQKYQLLMNKLRKEKNEEINRIAKINSQLKGQLLDRDLQISTLGNVNTVLKEEIIKRDATITRINEELYIVKTELTKTGMELIVMTTKYNAVQDSFEIVRDTNIRLNALSSIDIEPLSDAIAINQ